ncbi:MAG: HAMP domain-containing histidine kinase [bacterium]|nr:HAMP domain-containing histidine kinase [bacterium]
MKDALQKTSFVSNVSHELKTPLTSIRMYAELLFEGRVKDPEKKKNYLQVIVSESQRLTRLVNNVLDFSRLEQGSKKYHPEQIDLNEFLAEIIESHRLRLKEVGMTLETRFLGEKIIVKADRDAIEQVFINLIDNSVKYAGPGIEIVISLNVNNKGCEIRVEDRGPGVPEADRHKIFEKFHRVDNSLTSKQQGSGLGLSIARKILRDLGGDLVYESRDGGGSCFVVLFPHHLIENIQ